MPEPKRPWSGLESTSKVISERLADAPPLLVVHVTDNQGKFREILPLPLSTWVEILEHARVRVSFPSSCTCCSNEIATRTRDL